MLAPDGLQAWVREGVALSPVLLAWVGSLWPPKLLLFKHRSQKAAPHPSLSCVLGVPGSAVRLSVWGVCLSVGLGLPRGLDLCLGCSCDLRGAGAGGMCDGAVPPSPHPQPGEVLPWGAVGGRGGTA